MTSPTDDPGVRPAGEEDTRGSEHWRVEATSRFQRDVARLPPRVATAIVEYVTSVLPENPLRMTRPLGGDLEGYRSARRGDYRVIIRIDYAARVVILHRAAHRAHVYRPG